MAREFMPKSGLLMPHIVMNRDAAVAGVSTVDGEAGTVVLSDKYAALDSNGKISSDVLPPITETVSSVNTKTGDVVLSAADILDSAGNTVDSTASVVANNKANTPVKNLETMMARMAAGQTVKIACYGDSTTAGSTTTGYVPNTVDGDGNAVGVDHNAQAPNSWPVKMQAILRDMYNNTNIFVYNAGYGGQRLDNGWAVANYDKAIPLNTYYGICDIVIVDFSLNDFTSSAPNLENHITQSRLLIRKIIANGSVPVLLSSGPTGMTVFDGEARDNKAIELQYTQAKRGLAKEFGIAFIDKATAIKDYYAINKVPGVTLVTDSPDFLHLNDKGNLVQASFIAGQLYSSLVTIERGGREAIGPFDARANPLVGRLNSYTSAKIGRFGGCPLITVAKQASVIGKNLYSIWVWSNSDVVGCIYRGQDNDGQTTNTNNTTLKVYEYSTNSYLFNDSPPNVGFTSSGGFRSADQPMTITTLGVGLYKINLTAPAATRTTDYFYGWFEFVDEWRSGPFLPQDSAQVGSIYRTQNLLTNNGMIFRAARTAGTVNRTYYIGTPQDVRGANAVSFGKSGRNLQMTIEGTFGLEFGIVLIGNDVGWNSTTNEAFLSTGLLLHHLVDGTIGLYSYSVSSDGTVVTSAAPLVKSTATVAETSVQLKISFAVVSDGSVTITADSGVLVNTNLFNYTVSAGSAKDFPTAGYFGASFESHSSSSPASAGLYITRANMISF